MTLTPQDELALDEATAALNRVKELIESAQLGIPDAALRHLDEADTLIDLAESRIDSVHRHLTQAHGSEHMAFQFGQTGLALVHARAAVGTLRDILNRARE